MKISLFTVNNFGDPEPIIVTIPCTCVTIGEDPSVGDSWPTTDYKVKGDDLASDFMQIKAGVPHLFEGPEPDFDAGFVPGKTWLPGDIVGYVQTVSGSTTFFKKEEQKNAG